MSERPPFNRIPKTENAVIVHEEACEVKVGAVSTRRRCRVVFDVTEFPSTAVEIPDLDSFPDTRELVSIKFVDSGFELSGGMLGGISWNRRPSDYPFQYYVRYTEPIKVAKNRKTRSVEALLYNMGRFSFRGTPTRGLDVLQLAD